MVDGKLFTIEEKIIFVIVNYRVGPLGFLVQDKDGKGGLNGVGDFITAL